MPVKNKELKTLAKYIASLENIQKDFDSNKKIVSKYIDRIKYKKQSNQIAGLLSKKLKKNDSSRNNTET